MGKEIEKYEHYENKIEYLKTRVLGFDFIPNASLRIFLRLAWAGLFGFTMLGLLPMYIAIPIAYVLFLRYINAQLTLQKVEKRTRWINMIALAVIFGALSAHFAIKDFSKASSIDNWLKDKAILSFAFDSMDIVPDKPIGLNWTIKNDGNSAAINFRHRYKFSDREFTETELDNFHAPTVMAGITIGAHDKFPTCSFASIPTKAEVDTIFARKLTFYFIATMTYVTLGRKDSAACYIKWSAGETVFRFMPIHNY